MHHERRPFHCLGHGNCSCRCNGRLCQLLTLVLVQHQSMKLLDADVSNTRLLEAYKEVLIRIEDGEKQTQRLEAELRRVKDTLENLVAEQTFKVQLLC